jgi:hypothetical protein
MADPLVFVHEDNGFCRVMFERKGEGYSPLYCWQLDGPDTFKFYRCTNDGEPSHKVTGWDGVPAKDLTPANPGETDIGRALNAFLGGEA